MEDGIDSPAKKKQKISDYFAKKIVKSPQEGKQDEHKDIGPTADGKKEAAEKEDKKADEKGDKKIKLLDFLQDEEWKEALKDEFQKPYFKKIITTLQKEAENKVQIFPPEPEIFAALNLTPLHSVKCVILGQDPYHDDGQAHGLSFSVKPGIKIPPSLRNIYKELENDIPDFKAPKHGCLEKWARDGVLLLNASLTVQAHRANSHSNIGWQVFTDAIIRAINSRRENVVFILWGAFAQKKGQVISRTKHHILSAAHPSPLSANKFFGCRVFSKTNDFLQSKGISPVDWTLPEDPVLANSNKK